MKLRDYQIDATKAIFKQLKNSPTSLAVLHTGLGKAVILVKLLEEIRKHRPNFRAIIMVRQVKLIKQILDKFQDANLVGAVCGTLNQYNQTTPFVVASFETLRQRAHEKYDLCVIDEAHQTTAAMWDTAKSLAPKIVGFTATDFNSKGFIHGENKRWGKPCYKSTEKLALKYLCPIVLKSTEHKISLKKLRHSAGDYSLVDAAERYTDDLLSRQVSEIRERTRDRNKVAIICCNIDHAERVLPLLPSSTITHSKMPNKQQMKNMESWEFGDKKYMVSVNQITTGFDFPELDCIAALRPTRSYTMYVQMLGRGRRRHPSKKDCLFLDYGNIVENLGLLEDVDKNIFEKKPCFKICPECESYLPTSLKSCLCGFVFNVSPVVQKVKGDYEKNLSPYAYDGGTRVDLITSSYHTSKAGNKTLKIMYWSELKMIHCVYFLPYQKKEIGLWAERNIYPHKDCNCIDDLREKILNAESIVKSIVLIKDGKYKKIKNYRW